MQKSVGPNEDTNTTPESNAKRISPPLSKIPGVPLYVQIREAVRREITDGDLQPGERIPSEDELGTRFGVSRMTVRKAIADLIQDGLLYRSHGVGTFVTQVQIDRDHTRLTDFFESAQEQGLEATASLLSRERIRANPKVAQALALEEGEEILRIGSLRSLDGEPITLHYAHVPAKLATDLPTEEFLYHSVWLLIENRNSLKVKRAVEHLEAQLADRALARLLQIERGAPVLYKERTVFAEDGTPVEYEECYNRGDRYRCSVILHH